MLRPALVFATAGAAVLLGAAPAVADSHTNCLPEDPGCGPVGVPEELAGAFEQAAPQAERGLLEAAGRITAAHAP